MAKSTLELSMIVLRDYGLCSFGVLRAGKIAFLELVERNVEARAKEPCEAKLLNSDQFSCDF